MSAAVFAGQMNPSSKVVIARRFIDFAEGRYGWDLSTPRDEDSVGTRHVRLVASSLTLFEKERERVEFTHFLGYSVGQFAALAAMGSIDEFLAIELVAERARCLENAWKQNPSKMLTVIGVPDQDVEKVVSRFASHAFVSARNSKMNTSIGLDLRISDEIERDLAELKPIKVIEQTACGAWHTPFMAAAADEYRPFLEEKLVMKFGRGHFIEHTAGQIFSSEEMTRSWLSENLLLSIKSPVACRAMFETLRNERIFAVTEFGLSPFLVKIIPFISRDFRANFSEQV